MCYAVPRVDPSPYPKINQKPRPKPFKNGKGFPGVGNQSRHAKGGEREKEAGLGQNGQNTQKRGAKSVGHGHSNAIDRIGARGCTKSAQNLQI